MFSAPDSLSMVRRVQANQAGGQDYYSTSDNYYGYEQSQQPPADQNYYYGEQAYQPDQTQFQQPYSQPANNYNYASPAANSYAQPVNNYGSEAYSNSNQYNNYNSPVTQPFIQPEKTHSSPIVQNAGYGATYGVQASSGSWLSAFGTGGFEGEAPLLEELGINFGHIKNKTIASINPFRKLDAGALSDSDLAGPLLFCFLFGMSLLLSGKVHFGYIYGVATLGWLSVFVILNLMSEAGVSFYLTASVLGYCLLPMVLLSAISVLLRLRGGFGFIMAAASITWCTTSSSTLFVSAFNMKNQQVLIAYPIFLFYSCFALMTVF